MLVLHNTSEEHPPDLCSGTFVGLGYVVCGTHFRPYGELTTPDGKRSIGVLRETGSVEESLSKPVVLKIASIKVPSRPPGDVSDMFMQSCLNILKDPLPPSQNKTSKLFNKKVFPALRSFINIYIARVNALSGFETDRERLSQRLKQIWFGIHTKEYQSVAKMSLSPLGEQSFAIPDATLFISKRDWSHLSSQWRINIHALFHLRRAPETAHFFLPPLTFDSSRTDFRDDQPTFPTAKIDEKFFEGLEPETVKRNI